MLRAGQIFLGMAALGLLLLAFNAAHMGPCPDALGILALMAFIFGAPVGVILLVWATIRSRRKKALPSETTVHSDLS